jgi:hypothetical protein
LKLSGYIILDHNDFAFWMISYTNPIS